MSAVENVVGGLLVLFFLIIAAVIISISMTQNTFESMSNQQQVFADDQYSNNINTILKVTEDQTKKPIANLLGNALFFKSYELEHINSTVDVRQIFEENLDYAFGDGKYYAYIEPRIREIGLKFVIDGSNSLDAEANELAERLEAIILQAGKDNRTVDLGIYYLTNEQSPCDLFNYGLVENITNRTGIHLDPMPCKKIHGENYTGDLYATNDTLGPHTIPPYSTHPTTYEFGYTDDFSNYTASKERWKSRNIRDGYGWENDFLAWIDPTWNTSFYLNYSYGSVIDMPNANSGKLIMGGVDYIYWNHQPHYFSRNVIVREQAGTLRSLNPRYEIDFMFDGDSDHFMILLKNNLNFFGIRYYRHTNGSNYMFGISDSGFLPLNDPLTHDYLMFSDSELTPGNKYKLVFSTTLTGYTLRLYHSEHVYRDYVYSNPNNLWHPSAFFYGNRWNNDC